MRFEVKDHAALQRAVEAFCRFLKTENVPEERVFDSRLAINELVGNVLRHTDGVADFCGQVKDGFVEVCVRSAKRFTPPEKSVLPADVFSEHGRGLFLVDSVSEERVAMEDGGIKVRIRIYK